MFIYSSCPLCSETKFKPFLTCKDHTVSQQQFNIVECQSCGFKFTNPIPEISDLGAYYKSEEYISHSDTKKGLISKLYHAVRNRTIKQKIELISEHVSRGTILDYGCGTGAFLRACKVAGWDTFGLEPDTGAREIAKKEISKVYDRKDLLEERIAPGSLSAITLWHVLEHVTDLSETLNFFRKLLSNQGVLIIAVPNHISLDAKYYSEFWAAYDVPRHLYHFQRRTLEELLSRHGFNLMKMYPMRFDSFYVSLLSEKYKTGKTNYFQAFKQGLRSNLSAKSPDEFSSVIYVFKKQ